MPDPLAREHAELLSAHAVEAALNAQNEADLRHHLWLFFQPWATGALGLNSGLLTQEGTGTSGRFDSRIGRSIIEYKPPGSLSSQAARRTAASQALGYVEDVTMAADVVVVTDGTTWAHYRDESAPLELGEQGALDLGDPVHESDPAARFIWRDNGVSACGRVLSLIATVRTEPVTSAAVARRLGPSRPEVRALLTAFSDQIRERDVDDRIDTLLRQWVQLAGVSYGIERVDDPWPRPGFATVLGGDLGPILQGTSYAEALFTLHTYVAFAAKMIGTELLSVASGEQDNRPTAWESLPNDEFCARICRLEEGEISAELRAPGLLAGDLFGWYAPTASGDPTLSDSLRSFVGVLGEFAWARVANSARGITGDLLRDFYASVVPRPLRKALGEFFTPQWLAERTLVRAIAFANKTGESVSVLDPSCGSGTFLVAALHRELAAQDRLHPQNRGTATQRALERVVGFDINPVAVLMSRINLLLALGDRIEALTAVAPRVYESDSILLPDPIVGQAQLGDLDFRRLPLTIGNIDVPGAIATLGGLHVLRENIEGGITHGRSEDQFKRRLRPDLVRLGVADDDVDPTLDASAVVYGQVAALHEAGRDGVWARIIEQAFAPATLDQVDVVVGNPPWISWKALPELWQERSRSTWESWGLWSGRGGGGGTPLGDIATLLVARSIVTYAKANAVVAFVLPESILVADPGNEKFRRCALAPDTASIPVYFRPLAVDDWTAVKPFAPDAANSPVSLYLQTRRRPTFPIPKNVWSRRVARTRIASHLHWGEARLHLTQSEVDINPVDDGDFSSPWVEGGNLLLLRKQDPRNVYVWGQGFNTRGLDGAFYVDVISEQPDPDGLILVRTRPGTGRSTSDLEPRTVALEAEYLWPLVRGANVSPFRAERSGEYVVVPHDPANLEHVLTADELVAAAPRLFDYFEPLIDRLLARSPYQQWAPSSDAPWGIYGPFNLLTRQTNFVLSSYMNPNRRPPIAVHGAEYDPKLGRVTACYPNNKTHFHVTPDPQEADYLCAWMNSQPAQDGIARTATSTAISSIHLQRVPVPKFDPSDPSHERLSEIGRLAAEGQVVDQGELNNLVISTAITANAP